MDITQKMFRETFVLATRFFLLSLFGLALQSCSTTSKNFPADIAIAAYGEANKEEKIPATKKLFRTDKSLQCLLGKSDFNNSTSSSDCQLEQKLKNVLVEAKGEFGDNDDREEIKKALQLIKTGQFFRDTQSAVKVLSTDLFPKIRKSIISDLHEPKLLSCGITAPIKDIFDNESLFGNALGCIYDSPTGEEVGETARILLENKSVRLAIVAYARANGINLNERDLEAFRETALNTKDPDLGPLVEVGIARLKEEYGVDRIDTALNEMDNNQFGCEK